MNNINATLVLLLLALFLAACGADDPQSQLKEIETLQSKNFPLTDSQQADVARLVSDGTTQLAAGDQAAASEKFSEALKILNNAADADRFNKSE